MKTRRGQSILELLAIIMIIAIIVTLTGKLFADGWMATRRAIAQADNNRMVGTAMKRWQRAFHETDPAGWTIKDGRFSAGQRSIYRDGDSLVFDYGTLTGHMYLPEDIECRFAIERHPGMADCAVMTLVLKSYYYRHARPHEVRIVACGGGDPK